MRTGGGLMDLGAMLLHLLVVLVAARLAAEFAERVKQPAVLAEIVVGILIGPSVLGWVRGDEFIRGLGDLGVILLLFEVGRQMDIADLGRVGAAALKVASIGVVVPMAIGYFVMRAAGLNGSVSIFLAAGITATSVGITARVFGDLRALTTSEARIVLGAAVADDVAGLLVLTVVVRVVTVGHVQIGSVLAIVAIAVGFVVIATVLGVIAAPAIFSRLSDKARTEGTVMALALAFALGVARLASAAKLAPIVGAFVAGLAVARSDVRDEIHRKLTPLGHLFIPVFFLQIGIDTKLKVFARPDVLGVAALLCLVAIGGKIVAGLGVARGKGDRLLVGLAMIPRGEVGLIFAGFGLTHGILNSRNYAVLVLVVLVTSLVTPPVVRLRVLATRKRRTAGHSAEIEPDGGWLRLDNKDVELAADPPPALGALIGLRAAVACASRQPGPKLLEWLSGLEDAPAEWTPELREELFTLLRDGSERSWRFLDVIGLLPHVLPDLDNALQTRKRDPFVLDPAGALRWNILEDLKALTGSDYLVTKIWPRIERAELVLLGAVAREAFGDDGANAMRFATTLGLDSDDAERVGFLVAERHLLPAAAARLNVGTEDAVLDLAAHIGTRELADELYVLTIAENAMESWQRERIDELQTLVQEALAHPDLTGKSASDLVEQRRVLAMVRLDHMPGAARHLEDAPRRYILASTPETIARHLRMVVSQPGRDEARVEVEPGGANDEWIVHIAVLDRRGLLAAIAGAFAKEKISVEEAQISTWQSGLAIDVFRVTHEGPVDPRSLGLAINHAFTTNGADLPPPAPIEGVVDVDNRASPWHTIVSVQARDRSGLLYRVASALARAGVEIHQALVTTKGNIAVDTFWVTGRDGAKLDAGGERSLREAFAGTLSHRWPSLRRHRPAGPAQVTQK